MDHTGVERPLVSKNVAGSVNAIPNSKPFVNPQRQELPSLVVLNFSIGTNPRGLFLFIHFKPCFELLLPCYGPSLVSNKLPRDTYWPMPDKQVEHSLFQTKQAE